MVSSEQTQSAQETAREAVGVFHDVASFETTIDELLSAGYDRAEISLLADTQAVEDKLGHSYEKVQELEDDPDVPRAVYVGREGVTQGQAGIIGGLFLLGSFAATAPAWSLRPVGRWPPWCSLQRRQVVSLRRPRARRRKNVHTDAAERSRAYAYFRSMARRQRERKARRFNLSR